MKGKKMDMNAKRDKEHSKIRKVMHEFMAGSLKSGGKKKVTSKKQAIAIAMSEAGKAKKKRK